MTESYAERSLRGRLAAHTRWANEPDRLGATEPARRGLLDKFLREVDPTGRLDPAERQRLADSARKAFYTRMALKSAQSRRRKRNSK